MVDYGAGIADAVRHLAELGHRRMAFIGGPPGMPSSDGRRRAFEASLERQVGERPAGVYEADFRVEGGRLAAAHMLRSGTRPTAVVVANDAMALGVLRECRAAGLAVPRDISVVGHDDIALAALTEPPLTTVMLPRHALGRKAVEALIATIGHPEQLGVEIPIPTSLIVRQSTGPVPSAIHRVISTLPSGQG
jgi:LacI family transcriptional regulator